MKTPGRHKARLPPIARNASSDTSGSGTPPGYGVRVGQMKGVVHACADQQTSQPSMADSMELYNLTADPYETNDVSSVGGGPQIVERIKRMLVGKGLSCACWQC